MRSGGIGRLASFYDPLLDLDHVVQDHSRFEYLCLGALRLQVQEYGVAGFKLGCFGQIQHPLLATIGRS